MDGSSIFRSEADELLQEIETCILTLETENQDGESIDRLFRAMHTLKGSGAMFGYDDIADFTHHFENLLDEVRQDLLAINDEIITLLFQSHDHLHYLFDCTDKQTKIDCTRGKEIIKALDKFTHTSSENLSSNPGPPENTLPTETLAETSFRIVFCPNFNFLHNGSDPALLFDELRELGQCQFFGRLENLPLFDTLHPDHCYATWDIILTGPCTEDDLRDVFIFVEDDCQLKIEPISNEHNPADKRLGEILVERGEVGEEHLQRILALQKPIGELLVENQIIPQQALDSALVEQQEINRIKENKLRQESNATLRVNASKLDALVDLVGELVTVQARLLSKTSHMGNSELTGISEEIGRLSSGLRDETMSLRMVQVGATLSNLKRLVRDLSKNLGKQVAFVVKGEETELDKSVIEQLKDPLIHIVRNSLDHGLETPLEREMSGKESQGTLVIEANHVGSHVEISITDDGRGLDTSKILTKATQNGLVAKENNLRENEIHQLIFAPGFSTAEAVTDLSGRGVGMDVVKKNVESLRGTIDVKSCKGLGTTITLKLPLTLAIIDGLMVQIKNDFYIIPLASVEECLEISDAEIHRIEGRHLINLRGDAIPYILLRDLFGIHGNCPELEQIVIIKNGDRRLGLVVDKVIGSHQTVIKSLGKFLQNSEFISGATILGDGNMALILSVHQIFNQQ